jgi:hypothetical protein
MTTSHATTDHHASDQSQSGHHSPARPSYDDINVGVVILIGVISTAVTLATIWFVEGIYYHWHNGLVRERNFDVTNPIQADIIHKKKLVLDGDTERGITSIESVMPTVIQRFEKKKPAEQASGKATDDHTGESHIP